MKRILLAAAMASTLGLSGIALAAPASNSSTMSGSQVALPSGMSYPVCDRTHTDSCMQLGENSDRDRELMKSYPQCAKMAGKDQKGACINSAANVTKR